MTNFCHEYKSLILLVFFPPFFLDIPRTVHVSLSLSIRNCKLSSPPSLSVPTLLSASNRLLQLLAYLLGDNIEKKESRCPSMTTLMSISSSILRSASKALCLLLFVVLSFNVVMPVVLGSLEASGNSQC